MEQGRMNKTHNSRRVWVLGLPGSENIGKGTGSYLMASFLLSRSHNRGR